MTERCKTCGQLPRRSTEQNKLYWALLHEISDKLRPAKETYAPETWHLYFRKRFLGATDIKLPNGVILTQPVSTTSLDKNEMADYIGKIESFAAEHGVFNCE